MEEKRLQRELGIRRRIAETYNKQRSDFEDLKSYNDYLEQVEEIVQDLCSDRNTEKIQEALTAYRLANAKEILENKRRSEEQAMQLRRLIDTDADVLQRRRRYQLNLRQAHREAQLKLQEEELVQLENATQSSSSSSSTTLRGKKSAKNINLNSIMDPKQRAAASLQIANSVSLEWTPLQSLDDDIASELAKRSLLPDSHLIPPTLPSSLAPIDAFPELSVGAHSSFSQPRQPAPLWDSSKIHEQHSRNRLDRIRADPKFLLACGFNEELIINRALLAASDSLFWSHADNPPVAENS